MKKLPLIFILFSLLLTPAIVFSTPIYDNTNNSLFMNLYTTGQVGDEVTLAGSERLVTEFMFGYINANVTGNEKARIRFYLNDGEDGKPKTLLKDLGSYPLQANKSDNDLIITGLNILIPGNTFTWTVEWEDFKVEGEKLYLPAYRLFNPPTIGSSGDFIWQYSEGLGWGKIDTLYIDNLKAQIKAEPVPEPGILILLGISMASIVGLKRWWKD